MKQDQKQPHVFGGPSTNGTTHCFKCGAIKKPDGTVILNTTPIPKWVSKADCE